MSSNAPAGSPERRRSAVAHLRRQDHRHADRLGDDRDRRRAAHRSIGVLVLPWSVLLSFRHSHGGHQRASYWLGPGKVNDFTILVRRSVTHTGASRGLVPVGSPRKSAAIIPFVNNSGLPIGSGRNCLMIWAHWLIRKC